jgi:hypothetical protein
VLERGRAPLDACYARARTANPNLGRTHIDITFSIDPDGTTKTVDLKYRNKMDDSAKECMRDAALGLRFPVSMAGRQTATIVFTPPASGP